MDEIEAKTLALLNAAEKEMGLTLSRKLDTDLATAVAAARAIEQHEAFRQEVSDAVERAIDDCGHDGMRKAHISSRLGRFILLKPDPIAEAWIEATGNTVGMEPLNAALAARGLEIREMGQ